MNQSKSDRTAGEMSREEAQSIIQRCTHMLGTSTAGAPEAEATQHMYSIGVSRELARAQAREFVAMCDGIIELGRLKGMSSSFFEHMANFKRVFAGIIERGGDHEYWSGVRSLTLGRLQRHPEESAEEAQRTIEALVHSVVAGMSGAPHETDAARHRGRFDWPDTPGSFEGN